QLPRGRQLLRERQQEKQHQERRQLQGKRLLKKQPRKKPLPKKPLLKKLLRKLLQRRLLLKKLLQRNQLLSHQHHRPWKNQWLLKLHQAWNLHPKETVCPPPVVCNFIYEDFLSRLEHHAAFFTSTKSWLIPA